MTAQRGAEPVKLLIEGGVGSFGLDLRGIGVNLHAEAFAFRMPDDSMAGENIRCGDIAIVEPCRWALEEGAIVMLALDGVGTLRRVTYREGVAYFQSAQREKPRLLPAWEHAFSGVVTAILRICYHGRALPRQRKPARRSGSSSEGHSDIQTADQPAHCTNRLRDEPLGTRALDWRAR